MASAVRCERVGPRFESSAIVARGLPFFSVTADSVTPDATGVRHRRLLTQVETFARHSQAVRHSSGTEYLSAIDDLRSCSQTLPSWLDPLLMQPVRLFVNDSRASRDGARASRKMSGMLARLLASIFLAAALLMAGAARAHHSFTAVYRINETIEIEGEIAQFQFRNPHVLIHVLVHDQSGKDVRWAAEWLNVAQLSMGGVTAQTFRPGDEVLIMGNPGRSEAEHRIRVHTITRLSDGFEWGSRNEARE